MTYIIIGIILSIIFFIGIIIYKSKYNCEHPNLNIETWRDGNGILHMQMKCTECGKSKEDSVYHNAIIDGKLIH